MISPWQIAANRLNAQRSTGPRTTAGKNRSRRNALGHGLAAETVIGVLEDPTEYQKNERAIVREYRPRTVIERELLTRLASLFWRLRRATAIETGLFAIQAGIQQALHAKLQPQDAEPIFEQLFKPAKAMRVGDDQNIIVLDGAPAKRAAETRGSVAQCHLRLMNVNGDIFEHAGRYKWRLWAQVDRAFAKLMLKN